MLLHLMVKIIIPQSGILFFQRTIKCNFFLGVGNRSLTYFGGSKSPEWEFDIF